jgi:hypothetical protein
LQCGWIYRITKDYINRLDFTLSKYKEILLSLKKVSYDFYTMEEWFIKYVNKGVVIRHDVDRRANNSLKKAILENSLGIKSTYYFRIKKCSFKKEIIKKISELGHEIGYHYEELSTAGNDSMKAITDFKKNLSDFREIYDVKTIAMHGKPTSYIDNRTLFENKNISEMGLIGDAYLSIDYSDKYYFSDTGRSWANKSKTNYRDYVNSLPINGINNSDELINFINDKNPPIIFLMTHPERWNDNPINYSMYYLRDAITRIGKIIYRYLKN